MILSTEEELKVSKHIEDSRLDWSHQSSIDNISRSSHIVGPDEPFLDIDKLPQELRLLGEALNS